VTSPAELPTWLKPIADAAADVSAGTLAPSLPAPPADARPSAVLILLAEHQGEPSVLLTERAATLRQHAGQISFPGGAQDPEDDGPTATALREAHEEVGLEPAGVSVLGQLPTLWLSYSNFAVTPVLATRDHLDGLHVVDEAEVAQVLRVPLDRLLDPEHRFSVVRGGWRGPAFDVGTPVPLWGFTAGILARLLRVAGLERPWDESRTRPLPEPR
jgi:8-oxo-dGTP pyrophosphatase MutT (NUDIX family)